MDNYSRLSVCTATMWWRPSSSISGCIRERSLSLCWRTPSCWSACWRAIMEHFFVQQFLSSHVNLLVLHILRHIHDLVYHPLMVTMWSRLCWSARQTSTTWCWSAGGWSITSVSCSRTSLPCRSPVAYFTWVVAEKTDQGSVSQWNKLLDEMVGKLMQITR